MSQDHIRFKIGWFRRESDLLAEASTSLEEASLQLQAARLELHSDTEIQPIKDAFDELKSALADAPDISFAAGSERLRDLSGAIAATGKNYELVEADNEQIAALMRPNEAEG